MNNLNQEKYKLRVEIDRLLTHKTLSLAPYHNIYLKALRQKSSHTISKLIDTIDTLKATIQKHEEKTQIKKENLKQKNEQKILVEYHEKVGKNNQEMIRITSEYNEKIIGNKMKVDLDLLKNGPKQLTEMQLKTIFDKVKSNFDSNNKFLVNLLTQNGWITYKKRYIDYDELGPDMPDYMKLIYAVAVRKV